MTHLLELYKHMMGLILMHLNLSLLIFHNLEQFEKVKYGYMDIILL